MLFRYREWRLILNGNTFKLPNNISLMMVLASFFFFLKGLLFLKKRVKEKDIILGET